MGDLVTSTISDGVAVVRRDNPPVNALTMETTRQLHAALTTIASDDAVRAVVMTGAGGRSFGAGSDITEFGDLIAGGDVVERKMAFENETFSLLASLPQPTVAAVKGATLGGGLELALACDLILAEEGAVVGFPEIKLGLFPASGGPVRAARRIGEGRVREMLYFGDPVPVEVAERWGLVNAVVPAGTVDDRAVAWAQRLAAQSVSGLRACKAAAGAAFGVDHGEREIVASLDLSRRVFAHPDAREGAAAFLARRAPSFPSAERAG